uniref:Putative tick kunitz 99 n=1 Tax=Ixodes ricinus TaxID=34613 RepID=V5IC45_IXORI
MFIQAVWILTIATKGLCSTSCQSNTTVNICYQDPEIGSGDRPVEFFFYDWRTDNCIEKIFYPLDFDTYDENKFVNLDECNTRCRRNVPIECFEDPRNNFGRQDIQGWTYNFSSLKCEKIRFQGRREPGDNVFKSNATCNEKCRIADLGLCAYPFRTKCKHGDDLYIWYIYKKQE